MANATTTTLEADERFVADLKLKCAKALQDNVFASSIILGWTHPTENSHALITYAEFPFPVLFDIGQAAAREITAVQGHRRANREET